MNPWIIVAEVGIGISLHFLQKWLADPQRDQRAKELTNKPSTTEGSPIPMVFGTVRVRQPVLAWYGGFRSRDPLDFGAIEETDLAVRYGVNMLFVAGIPMGFNELNNRLRGMWVGDKKIDLNLGHTEKVRTAPNSIYGGTDFIANSWNGTIGLIQFFGGGMTQQISDNSPGDPNDLNDITEIAHFIRKAYPDDVQLPQEIPGYRNQMLVALTGDRSWLTGADNYPSGDYWDAWYLGGDPQVPAISFEISTGLTTYDVGWQYRMDADPAAALAWILFSEWGGLNLDAGRIDTASFTAASQTLLAEGHGYSRAIEASRDARSVLQEIVNQTCGVLYEDPATGMYIYKLIRNDYNPATIPHFNADHVCKDPAPDITCGGWQDRVNQVRVRYSDRSLDYRDAVAVAENTASAIMQDSATDVGSPGGRIRSVTLDYPGVTTYDLASTIAGRDLNLLSQPLSQIHVAFNRLVTSAGSDAKDLRPGDVFKLTLPDQNISAQIFRVTKVDLGQLGDDKVIVDAVLDVFFLGTGAGYPGGFTYQRFQPLPVRTRLVTEAPYWMQRWIWSGGGLNDPSVQHILALGQPDDNAFRYTEKTTAPLLIANAGVVLGPTKTDVSEVALGPYATVATAYAKELEPYDTTTGLIVQGLLNCDPTVLTGRTWSFSTELQPYGYSLVMVGTEIMMYETVTDLGGGQLRLNNVSRALLDTAPVDHAVGESVWWIGTAFNGSNFVGTRGWVLGKQVHATMLPRISFGGGGSGSGGDEEDLLTIRERCVLPPRVASLGVTGKSAIGTLGVPSDGHLRSVSRLEESIEVFALRRNRTTSTIIRGDAADETQNEAGIQYQVTAKKIGGVPGVANPVTLATLNNAGAIAGGQGYLLGGVGHGTIDLRIQTVRTVSVGDGIGVGAGTLIGSWDIPTVRIQAPPWRNLLSNPRFAYNALTPGWTSNGAGTPAIGNDATSIPGDATGFYLKAAPSTSSPVSVTQTVAVDGYLARGMTARVNYYQRAINADTNDTVTVTLDALDSGLGVVSTNNSTAAAVTTSWTRRTCAITAVGAGVVSLKVTAALNEVATLGTTNPETIATDFELILGQHVYDQLTNGSFEAGSTASWTNVTNSFVTATTIASPSANYAQGGAFASSEIRQDFTLPTGYEAGAKAVLKMWRAQTINNDTGRVRLQILDGGGGVLASDDTTAENLGTLNQWVRRVLTCDVPQGAVTARVILTAVRTGGAGNSGACFDECVLSIHKDLDPRSQLALSFSAPVELPLPETWQEWWLQYGYLGTSVPTVFAGGDASKMNVDSVKIPLVYTGTKATGTARGGFSSTLNETPTYVFTRQSGGSAVELRTVEDAVTGRFANWSSSDPFTVVAIVKVDEVGFATQCGITGRNDSANGWGLEIDSTGHVLAILNGDAGVKSVATSGTVHDGAWHLAAIAYDPVGHTLLACDERASSSVSTAAGLGEILNPDIDTPFRIGRSRDSVDTIPGMIARIFIFEEALGESDIIEMFKLGHDPNLQISTYTRDKTAWCPVQDAADGSGNVLVPFATDQLPIGYSSALTSDGGSGFGLALARGVVNVIPSFDFAGASWVKDAGATLTQGKIDMTGKAAGCEVVSPNTSNGLKVIGCTVGATATCYLGFYAKSISGATTLRIEMRNASDVVKDTKTVTLTTAWKRFEVDFTGWDASSGTCRFHFGTDSASTMTFQLGHVMAGVQGTQHPYLWPFAGVTMAANSATISTTFTTELNFEGEVLAVGVSSLATPPATGCVCEVSNTVNTKDAREINANTGGVPRFVHTDSTPVGNTTSGTAFSWNQLWTLHGRWNATKMLDNAVNPYAGLVVTASVNSATYGRTVTFAYDTTVSNRLRIGTGNSETTTIDMLVRSVTVRAREQKLP